MNASQLIERNTKAHQSDGSTAWHMVAAAHEGTIRALAAELAVYRGEGQTPQRGCAFTRKPLGDAEVLVEYEFTPGDPGRYSGPPEHCYPATGAEVAILQIFVNGVWTDPADFMDDTVLERWASEIEGEATTTADDERAEFHEQQRVERLARSLESFVVAP